MIQKNQFSRLDREKTSVGDLDPDVLGPTWSGSEVRIRLLPFSRKGVERTEIMLENKILTQNFGKK